MVMGGITAVDITVEGITTVEVITKVAITMLADTMPITAPIIITLMRDVIGTATGTLTASAPAGGGLTTTTSMSGCAADNLIELSQREGSTS